MTGSAVDQQITDQRTFVDWWEENVSVRLRAGDNQHKKSLNADLRSTISRDQAETMTDISQQTVSKWRKRLEDVEGLGASAGEMIWLTAS